MCKKTALPADHVPSSGWRRSRLPSFFGLSEDLPSRLDTWRIAVVGTGSVGQRVATHIARLTPAALTLVDPACYKAESMATHAILPDAIGRAKAVHVAELCRQITPSTTIRAWHGPAQTVPLAVLDAVDLVFLATDNLQAELDVAQQCQRLAKPLIQASVAGDLLVAQVRFLSNRDSSCACLACGFGREEWRHLNRQTRFSCAGESNAASSQEGNYHSNHTMSVSFLCSLAADLAAVQALRHRASLGDPVEDLVLDYCGYTHRTVISPLLRNARCPQEHRDWTRQQPRRPLAESTPAELMQQAAGDRPLPDGMAIGVDGLTFVDLGLCNDCQRPQAIGRFIQDKAVRDTCGTCGQPIDPLPFYTWELARPELLRNAMNQPLGEIADALPGAAMVCGPKLSALFIDPSAARTGQCLNSKEHDDAD